MSTNFCETEAPIKQNKVKNTIIAIATIWRNSNGNKLCLSVLYAQSLYPG